MKEQAEGGIWVRRWLTKGDTYCAARMEPKSSLSANSAALAVSIASVSLCLASNCTFWAILPGTRCVPGRVVPVAVVDESWLV